MPCAEYASKHVYDSEKHFPGGGIRPAMEVGQTRPSVCRVSRAYDTPVSRERADSRSGPPASEIRSGRINRIGAVRLRGSGIAADPAVAAERPVVAPGARAAAVAWQSVRYAHARRDPPFRAGRISSRDKGSDGARAQRSMGPGTEDSRVGDSRHRGALSFGIALAISVSIWTLSAQAPPARRVMSDAAHHNILATASDGYRPLVRLLTDAYFDVTSNTFAFTAEGLATTDIVVIANAKGYRPSLENR
jgi:hypothetical protein